MNFKNISLLAVLLATGFVGMVVHAGDIEFKMNATERRDFIKQELDANNAELKGLERSLFLLTTVEKDVSALCDSMVREKRENRKKRISEDSFEPCVYDEDLRGAIELLEARIKESEARVAEVQKRYDIERKKVGWFSDKE